MTKETKTDCKSKQLCLYFNLYTTFHPRITQIYFIVITSSIILTGPVHELRHSEWHGKHSLAVMLA